MVLINMKQNIFRLSILCLILCLYSCKIKKSVISSNPVKFNDIEISFYVDTIQYNVELQITNNTNDTLYVPDSFYSSYFRLQGEKIWDGILFYNFIEIDHPPIPLLVRRLLPKQKITIFKNEFNKDFRLKDFDMRNIKYICFEVFYITLKHYHIGDKSNDTLLMNRGYFRAYSNNCTFYVNIYDELKYIEKVMERWEIFKSMNPNNF